MFRSILVTALVLTTISTAAGNDWPRINPKSHDGIRCEFNDSKTVFVVDVLLSSDSVWKPRMFDSVSISYLFIEFPDSTQAVRVSLYDREILETDSCLLFLGSMEIHRDNDPQMTATPGKDIFFKPRSEIVLKTGKTCKLYIDVDSCYVPTSFCLPYKESDVDFMRFNIEFSDRAPVQFTLREWVFYDFAKTIDLIMSLPPIVPPPDSIQKSSPQ